MTNSNGNGSSPSTPIYDVEEVFPAMLDGATSRSSASGPDDVAPQVSSALRDALGWRPRVEDPKAFVDSLTASFRLVAVEGHVEAQYVPRGYAVQADLGAVTGGQASLYRRATLLRTEMLRILDGQVSLLVDSDPEEMAAYRSLVRNAIERLVDELGTAGGPRVQVVDNYFRGLTGSIRPRHYPTGKNVRGQLGALRDKFGLVAKNVNTVDEESIRTSFWTLVDMVVDLQRSWDTNRPKLVGESMDGFLGTDLIRLSREMEAASDQVDELEAVLDSVLIGQPERRTLVLDKKTRLTLDDLLRWLHTFLSEEGRLIIQDAGKDGIKSAFIPTAKDLLLTYLYHFASKVNGPGQPTTLPAGFHTGRVRIATASTTQLLVQMTSTALKTGGYSVPIPTYVECEEAKEAAPQDPARAAAATTPPVNYRVMLHGYDFDKADTFKIEGVHCSGNTFISSESISGIFSEIFPNTAANFDLTPYVGKYTPVRDLPIKITRSGQTVYSERT